MVGYLDSFTYDVIDENGENINNDNFSATIVGNAAQAEV